MTNCPVCNNALKDPNKKSLFGTENTLIDEETLSLLNKNLPEELQEKAFCIKCFIPENNKGLRFKIKSYLQEHQLELQKLEKSIQQMKMNVLDISSQNTACYSNTPFNFESKQYVESVIIVDSGTRSTASDTLTGVWAAAYDNMAMALEDVQSVKIALQTMRKEIQSKSMMLGCNAVADIKTTYSDLAANGKILIHMFGTAGNHKSEIKTDFTLVNKIKDSESEYAKKSSHIKEVKRLNESLVNIETLGFSRFKSKYKDQ